MKKDVTCTQVPCHFTKNKSRAITKLVKKEKGMAMEVNARRLLVDIDEIDNKWRQLVMRQH
jgi:hypothetical protein